MTTLSKVDADADAMMSYGIAKKDDKSNSELDGVRVLNHQWGGDGFEDCERAGIHEGWETSEDEVTVDGDENEGERGDEEGPLAGPKEKVSAFELGFTKVEKALQTVDQWLTVKYSNVHNLKSLATGPDNAESMLKIINPCQKTAVLNTLKNENGKLNDDQIEQGDLLVQQIYTMRGKVMTTKIISDFVVCVTDEVDEHTTFLQSPETLQVPHPTRASE